MEERAGKLGGVISNFLANSINGLTEAPGSSYHLVSAKIPKSALKSTWSEASNPHIRTRVITWIPKKEILISIFFLLHPVHLVFYTLWQHRSQAWSYQGLMKYKAGHVLLKWWNLSLSCHLCTSNYGFSKVPPWRWRLYCVPMLGQWVGWMVTGEWIFPQVVDYLGSRCMSMKMVLTEQLNSAVIFSASSSSVAWVKMWLIFMNITITSFQFWMEERSHTI